MNLRFGYIIAIVEIKRNYMNIFTNIHFLFAKTKGAMSKVISKLVVRAQPK